MKLFGIGRLTGAIVAALLPALSGNAQSSAVERLHAMFEAAWEEDLHDDPRAATQFGDKRYNAEWADLSLQAWDRRDRKYEVMLKSLQRVAASQLSGVEQLNRDLFGRQYQNRRDLYHYQAHLRPLDQLNYSNGVLTANQVAEVISFQSVKDYEDWLARLKSMDRYIDQTITLMRAGMRAKNTQPRIIIERSTQQLAAHIVDDPARSHFFAPFANYPQSLPASERTRLAQAATDAIRTVVVPSFVKLRDFLDREYLPACRETVGIWDTPDGAAFYRNRVEWFTTTRLSPDEVHAIGQREVERIHGEMLQIIEQVGFKGGFAEFLRYLRTDAKFRYTNPDDLLRAYMVMSKRIDPLLPEYFGKLPRTPYGVRPIPAASAPYTTTAYYQPLSSDGARPGYFYVNLYKPEERPTYEIPVLTTHEAVPGHHLQGALAKELGELPAFRRDFEATAYVEGWGLYSESLGAEMGLYSDPYDKFGQLTYEMWRAVRLVVDTGMHHKRWTREQAIDFFKANAAKSELDIVNEIDRYIAWPGQATAYKIGELKIKELRNHAEDRLGSKFDRREFHDTVLASGPVPLDVLERNIARWVAGKTG